MIDSHELEHETEALLSLAGTIFWTALAILGRIPGACRVGLHDYCSCCSPSFCARCRRRDPWS
jgi:hypothetical protein